EGSGADGAGSLRDVATAVGESLGGEIRQQARAKGARQAAVQGKLKQLGYEPRVQESGEWTLRNCIFAELAASHGGVGFPLNAGYWAGLLPGERLSSLS